MLVIHSISSRWNSPAMPISIRLTVQLPPMKSLVPRATASWISGMFTGSRMITASSFMRSALAASIQ